MPFTFDTATTLARRLRDGEVGSRELTEHFIRRIEKHDDLLNAVVVRDFERALEAADRADAALARGERDRPLLGVPMTIKEAYDVEGLATTWGIEVFAKNVAASDAAVVQRFKEAGAHFLGKTNVPVELGDFQSYNPIYGTTRNPWNPERTPGGSSGGSAVSLAAGFCALESGSDIGGSIRNPAHYCGVYGHKPTWRVVSDEGHSLPGMDSAPDLAVVGPMARSARDLELAMDLIAGPDSFRARGWKLDLARPEQRSLSDFRVAVWPSDPMCPPSAAVADRVQAIADRLARLGATVSDTARPGFEPAESHRVYTSMLHGQLSAGVPDAAFEKMAEGVGALPDDEVSDAGAALRATTQTHRTWARNDHARGRLRKQWAAFFEDWDLVLCPQMPTTAFPHDHSPLVTRTLQVDGDARSYLRQLFWAGLVTVAYLPSTVFPTGVADDGLPIGVQAVGAEYADYTCIRFAELIAEEFGGFIPPPGYED